MNEPRCGQRVITDNGAGFIDTITAGSADCDVLRYRVTFDTKRRWYYLDELVIIPDPVEAER